MIEADFDIDEFLSRVSGNKPPFVCPIAECGSKCRAYGLFRRHMETHRPKAPEIIDITASPPHSPPRITRSTDTTPPSAGKRSIPGMGGHHRKRKKSRDDSPTTFLHRQESENLLDGNNIGMAGHPTMSLVSGHVLPSGSSLTQGRASLSYAESRASVYFTLSEVKPNCTSTGNPSSSSAAKPSLLDPALTPNVSKGPPSKNKNKARGGGGQKGKVPRSQSQTALKSSQSLYQQPRTCRCSIHVPLRLAILPDVPPPQSPPPPASADETVPKNVTSDEIPEDNVVPTLADNTPPASSHEAEAPSTTKDESGSTKSQRPSPPVTRRSLTSPPRPADTNKANERPKRKTTFTPLQNSIRKSGLLSNRMKSGLNNRHLGRLDDGNGEVTAEKFGGSATGGGGGSGTGTAVSASTEVAAPQTLDVPVPKFHSDPAYNLHKRPSVLDHTHYFRYKEKSAEELYETLEYQLEEEDLAWLQVINDQRKKQRLPEVTERIMEYILDRFEKECMLVSLSQTDKKLAAGNRSGLSSPVMAHPLGSPVADEDAICEVCLDGTCENTNVILFCDVCNLAVHQECYGVPYIPEGPWLCRKCIHSPSQPVQCALCPNQGGAFKRTSDDRWAHVVCALWIPEVIFANLTFLEPIEHMDKVDPKRIRLQCYICKQRKVGACIQCHKTSCYKSFHVTCAQQAGLYMRIENTGGARGEGIKKRVFCDSHAPPGYVNKGVKHSMFAYSDDEQENGGNSSEHQQQQHLKRTRRILEARRHSKPAIAVPILQLDKFKMIASQVTIVGKKEFLHSLFSFWQLKREARRGVPLLKRLQASGQRQHTFSANEEEAKRMRDQLKFWQRLRQDLEKARLLCELVRKRERLKREYLKLQLKTADLLMQPLVHLMRALLDELQKYDTDRIFAEAVSDRLAPDYRRIIHHPMDLGTMRLKVANHEYSNLASLRHDFDLMIRNCHTYNEASSIYYQAATRLAEFGGTMFREAEKIIRDYEYDEATGVLLHPPPEVVTEVLTVSRVEPIEEEKMGLSPPPSTCPVLLTKEEMSRLTVLERRRSLKSEENGGGGFLSAQRQLEILSEKMKDLKRDISEQENEEQEKSPTKNKRVPGRRSSTASSTAVRRRSSIVTTEVPPSPDAGEEMSPHARMKALNMDVQDTLERMEQLRKYCHTNESFENTPLRTSVNISRLPPSASSNGNNGNMLPPKTQKPSHGSPTSNRRRRSVSISIDAGGESVRDLGPPTPTLAVTQEPPTNTASEKNRKRRYRTRSEHSDTCNGDDEEQGDVSKPQSTSRRKRSKVQEDLDDDGDDACFHADDDKKHKDTVKLNGDHTKRSDSQSSELPSSTCSPTITSGNLATRGDLSSPETCRRENSQPRITRRTRQNATESASSCSSSTALTVAAVNGGGGDVIPTHSSGLSIDVTVSPSFSFSSPQNATRKLGSDNQTTCSSGTPKLSPGAPWSGAAATTSYGMKAMKRTPQLSSLDAASSEEDEESIRLEPLDVVWAKCRGYPWYPGLIIDPFMPRDGYSHNGVPIPSPPDAVMQRAPEGALQPRKCLPSHTPRLLSTLGSRYNPSETGQHLVNGSTSSAIATANAENSSSGVGGECMTPSPNPDLFNEKAPLSPGDGEGTGESGEKNTHEGLPQQQTSAASSASTDWYLVLFFDNKRTWQWLTRDKLEPLGVDKSIDDDKWMEAKRSRLKSVDVRQAYVRAVEHMCKVNGESYPYSDVDVQEAACPFPPVTIR